jgi:hypothetical protein
MSLDGFNLIIHIFSLLQLRFLSIEGCAVGLMFSAPFSIFAAILIRKGNPRRIPISLKEIEVFEHIIPDYRPYLNSIFSHNILIINNLNILH